MFCVLLKCPYTKHYFWWLSASVIHSGYLSRVSFWEVFIWPAVKSAVKSWKYVEGRLHLYIDIWKKISSTYPQDMYQDIIGRNVHRKKLLPNQNYHVIYSERVLLSRTNLVILHFLQREEILLHIWRHHNDGLNHSGLEGIKKYFYVLESFPVSLAGYG